MVIPKSQRVIYDKTPLHQVICQIRFPTILSIESIDPVEFQDIIRYDYPNYEDKIQNIIGFQTITQGISDIQEKIPNPTSRSYQFTSSDGHWWINLYRNFISLTTDKYTRWDSFKNHLEKPLRTFIKIYKPAFFKRVGLRYINRIKKSEYNLDGYPWDQLINPSIAGIYHSKDIDDNEIIDTQAIYHIKITDENLGECKSYVQIACGTITDLVINESIFIIDNDFATDQQMECENVYGCLDKFNETAGDYFRWCTTDTLRKAFMEI